MKLTAVVLTHNSQQTIKDTLDSLAFCSQIIIIDDYSTDKTISIARQHQAEVYQRKLNNNWADQRNFALKKANHEWVIFVDSDEIVSPALNEEILAVLPTTDKNGFHLPRQDQFLGKILKHGESKAVKLLRLAKKNQGQWHRAVHEVWQVEPPIGKLKNPLLHQRDITISRFLARIDNYTDLHARQLIKEGKTFKLLFLFIKPPAKFVQNYILRAGFLDGMQGLIFAILMSLHSLITRIKQKQIQCS